MRMIMSAKLLPVQNHSPKNEKRSWNRENVVLVAVAGLWQVEAEEQIQLPFDDYFLFSWFDLNPLLPH